MLRRGNEIYQFSFFAVPRWHDNERINKGMDDD